MSRIPSRLRRPIWLAGASLLVLVILGWVASLILPGMAAGWLLSLAEERWGVVGHTGEVRLNPLSLRLDVQHLALATVRTADDPFLRVESVVVDLPWSVLTGTRAVDVVQLVAPVVSARRAQDGVSNLPQFSSPNSSSPTSETSVSIPWRLGTVSVQRAMVSWEDATQDLRFAAGPLGLELRPEPEGSATSGEFRLSDSTRLARGTAETQVEPFVVPLTVAPSTVTVDRFAVSAPEGRLEAGAKVTLGAESMVQADYDLDVVLDRLAPWAGRPLSVTGDLRVSGTITGPPGAPVVSARLEGDRVRWERVEVHEFASVLRFDGGQFTVEQLNARVAGGAIEGTASIELADGQTQGNARMAWTDLRGQSLAAVWTDSPLPVDSTLTGVAMIAWSGHGPSDVTVEVDNWHGTTLEGGLDVRGGWRVATEAGAWVVSVDELAVGQTSVNGALRGALPADWSDILATGVTGQLEGQIRDLGQLARELHTMGLTGAVDAWEPRGQASWRVDLGGTVGQPQIAGVLTATGGLRGQQDGLALQAGFMSADEVWRIDKFNLQVADSALTGAASVHAETGALTGGLRLVVPDLAGLATFAPNAGFGAGELEVVVALDGAVSNPQIDVAMTGHQLRVAGQSLGGLDAELRIGADELLLERFVVQQSSGRLEAAGRLNWATGSYRVSLRARDMLLSRPTLGQRAAPVGAGFDLDLAGAGSFESPRGTARVVLRDVFYGGFAIDRLEQDIVLDPDEWYVRTVVPSLDASADLRIEPRRPWRYRLDAELNDADLTRLTGVAVDVGGTVRGALSGLVAAQGELSDWPASELTVELDRLDASYRDLPIHLGAPTRFSLSSAGLRLDEPLDLRLGGTQLTASGLLRDDESILVATLAGDLSDVAPLVDATRGAEDESEPATISGAYRLDIRLIGSTRQPSLSASLTVDDGVVGVADMVPLTDISLRAAYDGDGLTVERVSGRWQDASLRGDVVAPASVFEDLLPAWLVRPASSEDPPARVTLVVDGLGPEVLTGLVAPETLDDLSGEIGVEIDLVATRPELAALEGAVTLTTMDLEVAGFPVTQQRPTRVTIAEERVTVEGWAWQIGTAENTLTLGGSVDLIPEPTADLTVTGVADLSVFNAMSKGAAMAGDLYLMANVGGTLSRPTIDGIVEMSDGEARVATPRLLMSDLAGALVFQGTTLETIDLVGTANGGPIAVVADLRFPGFRPEGTVALSGESIPLVVPPGVRTELAIELLLTMAPDDAELTGVVTVLRGDYREAVNTAGGLRAMLESRTGSDLSETESSEVDEIRLNVQVRTEDEIVVNNNYGAGTLSVDTRLVGSLGRPGLTGRAAIGDGGQIFLGGNTFRIESGTIDFVDPDGVVPELDISARAQVGSEVITITLEGTAETLTTTMQSSGNLSESDIVSLLLTGRTLVQVGIAPGTVARDQALGLVSGEVLGAAGRSVGLDTVRLGRGAESDVRFDPSLAAGETDPGTRLTVGKNLSRQVELVASQSLRESGQVTWIVNYLPRGSVELRLVIDDETDRSYEFRHAVVFGQRRTETTTTQRRPEPRVSDVQVSGDAGGLETELRRLVRFETGDRFDFLRWQSSRDRIERELWDRGFPQARVRARREVVEDGTAVALDFAVERGPRGLLVVQGYEPSSRLRRAVDDVWRDSVFDAFLVDELEELLRRHLVEDGFLQPVVSVEVDDNQDVNEKRVVIVVTSGPRTRERVIEFVGHEHLSREQLESVLTPDREIDAWVGGDLLLQAVEALARSEGWLDARATSREVVFEDEKAALTIDVAEGPVFELSRVTVDGARSWEPERVRAAIDVRPGIVYRPGLADIARAGVLTAYQRDGYTSARVRVRPVVDRASESVTLAVDVDEGRRQRLHEIVVEGAVDTDSRVVDRALQLAPGTPVDPAAWNQARKRLYDTGVFRSVDIAAIPVEDSNLATPSTEQPVTAVVSLEEWPRYRLRYGLQLIDERAAAGEPEARGQIGVVADLTRQNLFGRAINLVGAVRYDAVQKTARGFVVFPSFFGRAVRSNLFASRLRERFGVKGAKSVSDRNGLTLEQRITPQPGLMLSYSYSFERDHTFDEDFDPDDPFAFDLTVNVARFNTSLLVDRRDDLFNTTRGWFHSSTFEWGVESLGSDLRFVKYVGQQNYFRPLSRGVVLASAARVGLGVGFEQELIPSERFFAGGGTTVRGYPQDGLGPTNFFGGTTGGEALIVLNQELRFPVWRMFGAVGFVDVGNVFRSVGDLSLQSLRVGTGLGLRAETPVGLLRADYGLPVWDDNMTVGRWFFSIGQAF